MIIPIQPPLPGCFDKGRWSLPPALQFRDGDNAVRVRDMDLEVGGGESKTTGADIRAVL